MSITLLWHVIIFPGGGPHSGLCTMHNEELVFLVQDPRNYQKSLISLFRPGSEQLSTLKSNQEKIRSIIGGYNDYGENFRTRPRNFGFSGGIIPCHQIFVSEMEPVGTYQFTDIINPFQTSTI